MAQVASGETFERRRRLPDERPSITHKFSISGHEGYITVGCFEDGQPGEIFITMSKEGSVVSGLMDAFATAISLCLQYGVPLSVLVDKFAHTRFEPSGFTNNPRIRIAKSVTDYIFRWLADKFMGEDSKGVYLNNQGSAWRPGETLGEGVEAAEEAAPKKVTLAQTKEEPTSKFEKARAGEVVYQANNNVFTLQADAPPCHVCGTIMVRSGACYKCSNCGATSGCS
jgi:ribonucleoside-diphosphate reductase alpha chain